MSGVAYNQVPDSENEIHGDEVAQRHGFKGGLVPGVTVSAYLCEPAVRSWGEHFLERGRSHIVVKKPLYDGGEFRVDVEDASPGAYRARLLDAEGTVCAEGRIELPDDAGEPPIRRRDRRKEKGAPRPPATAETFERLREVGMCSLPSSWGPDSEMATIYRDPAAMHELLRHPPDGVRGDGWANMAFVLGMTNWHLAANVKLGPWLHLQTDCQCFSMIESGAKLVVEGAVVDLFERKGHRFVDVDVAAFRREDSSPVMATRLRAIYQLRGG